MSSAQLWGVWLLKMTIFRDKLRWTYRETLSRRQTKWFTRLFLNWTVSLPIRILAIPFPKIHLVMIPIALLRILQHIPLQQEWVVRRLRSAPMFLFWILTVNQDLCMSFLHPTFLAIVKLWYMGTQVPPLMRRLKSFRLVAFLSSIK